MMSKKRRMSFRLDEDEALVIAPVEFWESLARHFQLVADDEYDPRYKEDWMKCVKHVDEWLERTKFRVAEKS